MAAATSRAAAVDKLDAAVAAITTENLRRRQNRANGCKPNSTSQDVANCGGEEHVQPLADFPGNFTLSLFYVTITEWVKFDRMKSPGPLLWRILGCDGFGAGLHVAECPVGNILAAPATAETDRLNR